MYEGHLIKVAKRLLVAREAIEQQCFERMDGLRELWVHLTPPDRSSVMRSQLGETTYKTWVALSRLYKQVTQ